jgi:geranylgeranyl pyrophosphate synthase
MSDSSFTHVNQFAAQQNFLVERLQFFLATLQGDLRADVARALEAEGKLLSLQGERASSTQSSQIVGSWPLLTLLVAQSIAPEIDLVSASSVAVAIECFICALDLLDDVEDDDQTLIVQTLGIARTLNVSTALLMLAQRALLSLSQYHMPAERILQLLDTLQACALAAATGQHRDILAEHQPAQDFTENDCIEIARGKAGSLMRLAFLLGAICAEADEHTREQFSALGELLGIAQQLDNDAHDLYYLLQDYPSNETLASTDTIIFSVKTDLVRGKKTLPIVLAAHREDALKGNTLPADEQKQVHQRALHDGIITTWGIFLLYHERARDILQEIETHLSVNPLLKLLLGL